MNLLSLDTAKLRSLINLAEVRDSLIAELKKVEDTLSQAFSGGKVPSTKRSGRRRGRKAKKPAAAKAPAKAGRPAKAAKKGGKRGALKTQILEALKASGAKGVSVKELSSKLGVKNQNIHVWFATTGKKAGVKKIRPGVYRLK